MSSTTETGLDNSFIWVKLNSSELNTLKPSCENAISLFFDVILTL